MLTFTKYVDKFGISFKALQNVLSKTKSYQDGNGIYILHCIARNYYIIQSFLL